MCQEPRALRLPNRLCAYMVDCLCGLTDVDLSGPGTFRRLLVVHSRTESAAEGQKKDRLEHGNDSHVNHRRNQGHGYLAYSD